MSAPTVRRRRLGTKLRALRGEQTLEEIAEHSGGRFVASKLSRLENAKSAAKSEDVNDLLDLYVDLGREVSDELRTALLTLVKEGSQRGWWHSYRGVLTPVYEDLISLEDDATELFTSQLGAVPGLAHTSEYARGIIRATAMNESVEAKVDALVEVRLARQAVLTRDTNPVKLWAIIAEGALRTRTADPSIMDEQLGRLLSLGNRPNVNIQVLRSDAALHVGQLGSFSLMSFGHPDLDVVHTENLTAALYVEEPEQVATYREAAVRLRAAAESVEKSAELIKEIRNQHDAH
ncbi:DUF5753 domain-containing protein [Streptomyces goshikiensis]|uniref:DUF5753 domain-containing protein n=1 Tax=Streptomyces goshikiensis TaxID=1942 RepID=UPI0036CDAA55